MQLAGPDIFARLRAFAGAIGVHLLMLALRQCLSARNVKSVQHVKRVR